MIAEKAPEAADAAPSRTSLGRRVAGNSLWLIAQPLLLNLLSVASNMYIARKLGAHDYGTFNLGFAQVALFLPLCNLGLRGVAVRAIAQERENAREIVSSVFALRLILTAGAALLATAWLALPVYGTTTRLIGLAAVASMVALSVGTIAIDLCMGFERSRLAAQPQIVGGILLTLLSVLSLVAGLGLPGFVAAYVLGTAIQTCLLIHAARRHFFAPVPRWRWPRVRDLLRQMRPFALMNLVGSVTDRFVLDLLFLGAVAAAAVVGPYSAAAGLIARLAIIPAGIGDAVYPAVASARETDPRGVSRLVHRSLFHVLIATLPISLCLAAAAPTVLWVLFGAEYVSAAPALRILAWLLPAAGLSYVVRESLAAAHQQDQVARVSVVSGIFLVILLAVGVPLLGTTGAALALLIREVGMLGVWLGLCGRQFSRDRVPTPTYARLAVAVCVSAAPFSVLLAGYQHASAVGASVLCLLLFTGAVLGLRLLDLSILPLPFRKKDGVPAAVGKTP